MKRHVRSDSYQWKICEISMDPLVVSSHIDKYTESIDNKSPEVMEKIEFIQELDQKLDTAFHDFLKTTLTPHQFEVYTLYASGLSQIEVAAILGCNQSSVVKTISGNSDYSTGKKVIYGGTGRKIQNNIRKDDLIIRIMRQIYNIIETSWNIHLKWYHAIIPAFGPYIEFQRVMEDNLIQINR